VKKKIVKKFKEFDEASFLGIIFIIAIALASLAH